MPPSETMPSGLSRSYGHFMDQSLDFKLTHYPNAARARRHVGMARLAALKVTSLPLSLGISCQP